MIEPIYNFASFTFFGDPPTVYTLPSEGSGKNVHVHFCRECGTKLALTFERWPDRIGVYVGTLDDPTSVCETPQNSRHIFASEARPGTILPAGVDIYDRHATLNDGTPLTPTSHTSPFIIGQLQ